jgi:hypothetical protein
MRKTMKKNLCIWKFSQYLNQGPPKYGIILLLVMEDNGMLCSHHVLSGQRTTITVSFGSDG